MTFDLNTADDASREQIEQYRSAAVGIVSALDEYEETHPKGAPCFADLMDYIKGRVTA